MTAGATPADRSQVTRQSLLVGVATGAYGISFGALSVAAGLDVLQTMALSLLLFSGGSQFAVVGVLGAGGAPVAAVATSTLLGVRNGIYGLQTARLLEVRGWRRLLAAHLTIDESTAVGVAQSDRALGRVGFWWTGAAVFVLWNLMTLLGAVVGNALGDPATWGLDAAAAAAFCGLLWPRLRSRDAVATAVLAAFLALVTAPALPVGVPVLVATLAAVLVGLRHPGRHEGVLEKSDPSDPRTFPGADPTP
ncbi:AzlC family ABC transporter permease [Janibacter sp. G1551]|uniref:AzlC family ABC transporter permease n=1 Tax=Janibacter sp. G1551 TaxID=3420440 RepID=UPI003CFF843D